MKIDMMPCVNAEELAREVEHQFGLDEDDINMLDLFGEMCENGSWQSICFDNDAIEDCQKSIDYAEQYRPDDADHYRAKMLVLTYLRDVLPEHDTVLWVCSW